MAGCGYVCPQCEGNGFTDDGEVCNWCNSSVQTTRQEIEESSEDE
jgi:hypothetical protein